MSLALSSVVSIKPLFSVTKPVALSSQSTFFQGCDCVIISRRRRRRRRRPSWIYLAGTLPSLWWNLGKIFYLLFSSASWDPWTNQNQPHPQKKKNWWRRKRRYTHCLEQSHNSTCFLRSTRPNLRKDKRQRSWSFAPRLRRKLTPSSKMINLKPWNFLPWTNSRGVLHLAFLNGAVLCMMKPPKALLQVCCAWCIRNSWSCNSQFWGGRHWQTHPGLEFNSWGKYV